MLFSFKKYDEDFFVEEKLGFDFDEKGDVLYIQFEKKNMNTMYIIHHLCKTFNIKRKQLGISGLKDKNAITRQRIAVYKSVLNQIGGEERFMQELGKIVKIIITHWHSTPLAIGMHKSNFFRVKLRFSEPIEKLSSEMKSAIEDQCSLISKQGFPNCFGQQRFGKGNRNFKRAASILETNRPLSKDFEIRFKLQAYASMYFNFYALNRWKKGQLLLQGDILTTSFHAWKTEVGVYEDQQIKKFDYPVCKKHNAEKDFFSPNHYTEEEQFDPILWTPTGLMLGNNMLLCPNGSKAFFRDRELIKTSNLLKHISAFKRYQLWGMRRPLWIIPEDFSYIWGKESLILSFSLPTGAYATVLLASIFGPLDTYTCTQNKLIIPNEID